MQLLRRGVVQPAYAGAGGSGGGSGPGLLAGIGPTRAGSSGGWVAAGVYESDIMRLPLGSYYEVADEKEGGKAAGGAAADGASSSPPPPPASFVMPLPSSPDDWASAEASPFVPASKLQVLSPGRLQAGLTTSRTRQFDDLQISLVPDGDGGGEDGADGSVDGLDGDGSGGGGRRRPGSGGRRSPGSGDVPPPTPRPDGGGG
jgi:hypothetical protein